MSVTLLHIPSLSSLADEGSSDKGPRHHGYTEVYDELLHRIRLCPVTIMEHGILGGDSLEMWAKYFEHPDTRVWGIDVNDWGYRPIDPRIVLRFGSNADTEFMRGTYAESGPLDACIEDASHFASHQIQAFIDGWPFIKPGGVWITEDVHTCHSSIHCDADMTFLGYMAKVAHELQDPAGADGCAAYNPLHPHSDISEIRLMKGLAIIRKRA